MSKMKTEIVMVLDRSGSMGSCASDVVGGFNSFIKEQKEGLDEVVVTLAQFDDQYDVVYNAVPIEQVGPLKFQPRGSTALLDAIGRTIVAAKDRMKDQRPGADVVILVVITDGQENASREFKKAQIASMIEECEKTLGWKVIYLGANQDAFSEAGGLGINASGAMTYSSTGDGTAFMFDSLSRGTASHRSKSYAVYESKGTLSADDRTNLNQEDFFSDEDRKENEKKTSTRSSKFGVDWKN